MDSLRDCPVFGTIGESPMLGPNNLNLSLGTLAIVHVTNENNLRLTGHYLSFRLVPVGNLHALNRLTMSWIYA